MKPFKLFVSMPMNGKTAEEIDTQMKQAHQAAERIVGAPLVLLATVFDMPKGTHPLQYIARSIELLAEADVAYFCDGWEQARGCCIEWMCAREYGVYRIEAYDALLKMRHCPVCGSPLRKHRRRDDA